MADLYESFKNPPKSFSPVPIWWWSGDRLDPARLRWQLERFAEGGVYNLIVLNLAPTGPLYGSDADDPPFFSEEWWEIFRGVCEDARDLGIYLWFYDQLGFSGANLQGELVKAHPEYAGQALERLASVMSGPGTLQCPAGGDPVGAAAIPVDDEGAPTGESVALPLNGGRVQWTATGRHRVMLFYTVNRGFDYFSAGACRALLDTVHEQFERRVGDYFGDTIVGSFQDELPSMPAWSHDFAQQFAQRHGYDLIPELAALWEDYGDRSDRIRRDYHALRAAISEETFFKPLHEWHEQRGLLCGFDQQGPARAGHPIDTVKHYADYQRTHRWFSAPGSDHHGEAKIHSSLAHLYDRPRVWIESFHSSGWGGTLEETFDWLLPWLRAGANLYDPHAVYYSTRGGWWEWAPPATDWRQPYWKHYSHFSRTVSRLCSTLSQGRHVCDVGILFPNATVQAGLRLDGATESARKAHDIYLQLVGSMRWYAVEQGVLDRARRDYDVLDDDSVGRATVTDGRLRIGEESYSTVVLPACRVLEGVTAEKLVEFVEAGGALVAVGQAPQVDVDGGRDQGHVRALTALFADGRARSVDSAEELIGLLAGSPYRVDAPVPTLVRQVGGATLVFVPAAFPRATELESGWVQGVGYGWLQIGYRFDPASYSRSMTVRVRGVSGAPSLWEPYSGDTRPLEYSEDGDGVEVQVPFFDGPAALLVWPDSATGGVLPEERVTHALLDRGASGTVHAEDRLDDVWTVEMEPTLDNRWGDFTLPVEGESLPVQRWRFRHAAEAVGQDGTSEGWFRPDRDDSSWATIEATFGPHGVWTGPAGAGSLPSPLLSAGAWQSSLEEDFSGQGGEWREVVYSLARGIYKDPVHWATLGPKGHVPEEFLDFGHVKAGEAVQLRTTVSVETPLDIYFALGAPARKRVWINGREVDTRGAGYLEIAPARLEQGVNLLELRLETDEDAQVRAHFAFVTDPDRYRRPEWMQAGDVPSKDSVVSYRKDITLPAEAEGATLQVGADAPCRVRVNGVEVGRQGGFDPYFEGSASRIQRYNLGDHLLVGANEIRIDVSDLGKSSAVLVDGLVQVAGQPIAVVSDETWDVTRDGGPAPLTLRRRQWGDPGWSHLWRRPHPLPASDWLEAGADRGRTVAPLVPDIRAGRRQVEWVRFPIPPGATVMKLPVHGDVTVYVDGEEIPASLQEVTAGRRVVRVELPGGDAPARTCALRVDTEPGYEAGAIFDAPAEFQTGRGVMRLGNWEDLGLSSYSGGVRYRQTITRARGAGNGTRTLLDLGGVRGTAEVLVNGRSVGVRIWSPYIFDVTDCLREGENELEVGVYNTLGPYVDAASPSRFVFAGQTVSGLMGPVRLLEVEQEAAVKTSSVRG